MDQRFIPERLLITLSGIAGRKMGLCRFVAAGAFSRAGARAFVYLYKSVNFRSYGAWSLYVEIIAIFRWLLS